MPATAFSAAIEAAYRNRQLTRPRVHVLYAVQRLIHEHPSHKRLAAVTRTSISTVRRALADAQRLGLLTWDRRVIGMPGARLQIANAYSLNAGPIGYSSTYKPRSFSLNTSPPAPALAAIASGMTERFAARWRGARGHDGVRLAV